MRVKRELDYSEYGKFPYSEACKIPTAMANARVGLPTRGESWAGRERLRPSPEDHREGHDSRGEQNDECIIRQINTLTITRGPKCILATADNR